MAAFLNGKIWGPSQLGQFNAQRSKIAFHAGSTPRVFDPMSTLLFGYASCTGVSILFADALRTLGVPARVAGTPAWHGNYSLGNHNWVEVFNSSNSELTAQMHVDSWPFLEALPAGGGETFANPCDKWFCKASRGFGTNGTRVFAAMAFGSAQSGAPDVYPMEWEPDSNAISGVERTDQYVKWCSRCR